MKLYETKLRWLSQEVSSSTYVKAARKGRRGRGQDPCTPPRWSTYFTMRSRRRLSPAGIPLTHQEPTDLLPVYRLSNKIYATINKDALTQLRDEAQQLDCIFCKSTRTHLTKCLTLSWHLPTPPSFWPMRVSRSPYDQSSPSAQTTCPTSATSKC